jgi:hypothetical protein
MSTATTSDPLVVNTRDGACWERRAVTSDGHGLYAAAGSCKCPEFLLVPLSELAEHGIVGTADALPVPEDDDRAKATWGRGEDGRPLLPMGAHWTDVPELVDRTVAGIQSRLDQAAHPGHWHLALASEGRPPGTIRTNVNGYPRTVGQFTNVRPADLDLVLHAHADLSWCLEMIAKFRTQVAELEAERHTTNEALSDAAEALRERDARIAELEAAQGTVFRSGYVGDAIPLGLYDNEAAAREHCEAFLRRESPTAFSDWLKDEEDGVAELLVTVDGEDVETGYSVTVLEVASEYDEEVGE